MSANPIAFELTVGTTPVRVSNTSLVADVVLINITVGRTVYVSTDGGVTRASLPPNVPVRFAGVNLNELWVYASSAGTFISIAGNTRAR